VTSLHSFGCNTRLHRENFMTFGTYKLHNEGVSITQRNNSAVLGFSRSYSYSHNGKWRFLKCLPGVLRKIFTVDRLYLLIHRIKIWGKSDDQILRNRGSKFKICPLYLRNEGSWGSKFLSPIGDRGSINRNLRVWKFL